jgi:hypothetical protein
MIMSFDRGRLSALVSLQRDSFRHIAASARVNHSHLRKFLDGRANLGPEPLQRVLARLGLDVEGRLDTQRVYDWAVDTDVRPLQVLLREMAPEAGMAFIAKPVTSTRHALPTENELAFWPHLALRNDSYRIRVVRRIPVDERVEASAFTETFLPIRWARYGGNDEGAVVAVRLRDLEFDEWQRGVAIDVAKFDAAVEIEPTATIRDVEKALAEYNLTWVDLLGYAKVRTLEKKARTIVEAAPARSSVPGFSRKRL